MTKIFDYFKKIGNFLKSVFLTIVGIIVMVAIYIFVIFLYVACLVAVFLLYALILLFYACIIAIFVGAILSPFILIAWLL